MPWLSRLLQADYDNGTTVYTYGFDVAGNLTNINSANRVYNAANQMTNDGTNTLTFDDNGNMTSDGMNGYTWDRANRLLSHAGTSYAYDGNSNRISQTVSSVVTEYLVDTQPALSKVLRESDSTNTTHFVHAPRGIHAQYDGTDWTYTAQDALGSVRTAFDDTAAIQESVNYNPVGVPDSSYDGFAFTGEQRDSNGLQYHRARYYDPALGVWASLDPLETANRYGYVSGNPINLVDRTGFYGELPSLYAQCSGSNIGSISLNRDWLRNYGSGTLYKRGFGGDVPGILNQTATPTPPVSTPDPSVSSEPCPLPGEHPLVKVVTDNEWLNSLGFCSSGFRTSDLNNIADKLDSIYGLKLLGRNFTITGGAGYTTWDNLASIGRGAWLTARALEEHSGVTGTGEEIFRNTFTGTNIRIGSGGGIGAIQSILAFAFNEYLAGVVPPVALGGDGRTIYMTRNVNMQDLDKTFIHELGHVLDFRLGTIYAYSDFSNFQSPSTMLFNQMGSGYFNLSTTKIKFGLDLATNPSGMKEAYRPGGITSGYGATNHYEDFAETWQDWVITKATDAGILHGLDPDGVDRGRLEFMNNHMSDFLERASD